MKKVEKIRTHFDSVEFYLQARGWHSVIQAQLTNKIRNYSGL